MFTVENKALLAKTSKIILEILNYITVSIITEMKLNNAQILKSRQKNFSLNVRACGKTQPRLTLKSSLHLGIYTL